ncbi:MAG: hypothetical protein IT280_03445 [Ignavibacteria bacterium]|nr:hypothetical protein [Ignavibacteria bacterium]
MTITFSDILNQKTWDNYETYVSEGIHIYSSSLAKEIVQGKKLKEKIRTFIEKNFEIKEVPNNLKEEEKLLSSGNVVGIDGTVAQHKTISGTMAQIGVVAVNYLNEKIQHSYFISEAKYKEEINDVTEYLFSHESVHKVLSNPVIRAVLYYRERELGLNDFFKDKYKLFHGPLLPFELMANPGRAELNVLKMTLPLLEEIIKNKKCFSIISRSQNDAYIRLGLSLNKGEYFALKKDVGKELIEDRSLISMPEKWREEDFNNITNFLVKDASNLKIGIIKISQRPYVFHSHKDDFDLAARIIARDAHFQKEKGFPLLVDYADNLCSSYFKASDFNKIIEYHLAKEGEYLSEMSEETLRQK